EEISLRELSKARSLHESFVELDLTLGRRDSSDGAVDTADLIAGREHCVILGDPGAGKTTTLKRVAALALKQIAQDGNAPIPILIRLRNLGPDDTLIDALQGALGIHLELSNSKSRSDELQRRQTVRTSIRGYVASI